LEGVRGGGLPAATYLQKAGARVALVEARHELAALNVCHEFIPGCANTFCTSAMVNGTAPMWEDLDLESYGTRLIVAPMHIGNIFPDGKCTMHYYDIETNCAKIARFSQKDAERSRRVYEGIKKNLGEFATLSWFSLPSPERLERLHELMADMWGVPLKDYMDMNAFEFLESMFESDHVRIHWLGSTGCLAFGDPGVKAQGPFTNLFSYTIFPGLIPGGNHQLAHVMLRIFLKYGGTILRDCPVKKIIVSNGVATGVQLADTAPYPEKELRATHAVLSGVSAPLLMDLVGEDEIKKVDAKLASKMKGWDMNSRGALVVCYVLKGFPKWKAAEYDPDLNKCYFNWKVWRNWDAVLEWYKAWKEKDLWGLYNHFHEIAIPGALDVTQVSPEGYLTVRTEDVVPYDAFEKEGKTPEMWDDENLRRTLIQNRTDEFEELAPGFTKQIVYSYIVTPLDFWRYNPSLVGGNAASGSYVPDQWYDGRIPYRLPIKGLYASVSVWPPQYSLGAGGYNAAAAIAEDMGIRDQSWWTHRPVEWFFKNLGRNMVVL